MIENKTIFWWGGLYRSTEHTAFLNLKRGVKAPQSGFAQLNGKITSEQIGAQIFIDGWGMISADHPDRAVKLAHEAAVVSHDGIAVACAEYIACLESLAYTSSDVVTLLRRALGWINSTEITALVEEIIRVWGTGIDWRQARAYIADNHDYRRYGGNCPIVTNFLVIVMSLLYGGDSFLESIAIAVSSGYDTDCNAGNVGCIQGIRLGLDELQKNAQLLDQVNDALYVVDAKGDFAITDAIQMTDLIVSYYAQLNQLSYSKPKQFHFPHQSRQGWQLKDAVQFSQATDGLSFRIDQEAEIKHASWLNSDSASGYAWMGSPQLSFGQSVHYSMSIDEGVKYHFFIEYLDGHENLVRLPIDKCSDGMVKLPANDAYVILDYGFMFKAEGNASVTLHHFEIEGSPNIQYLGTYEMSPNYLTGRLAPSWSRAWRDSTSNSTVDHLSTFCVSHVEENGLFLTGNGTWKNYHVSTRIELSMQKSGGIVYRECGLKRFYFVGYHMNELIVSYHRDDQQSILYREPYCLNEGNTVDIDVSVFKDHHTIILQNKKIEFNHSGHLSGGLGFLVSMGTLLVFGLKINEISK